jgi:hypothetical protein
MLPALREVTLPALRRIGRIARCTKSPCARRTSTEPRQEEAEQRDHRR